MLVQELKDEQLIKELLTLDYHGVEYKRQCLIELLDRVAIQKESKSDNIYRQLANRTAS